jgi:phosphonate ABC transporter permease subunit PhnE
VAPLRPGHRQRREVHRPDVPPNFERWELLLQGLAESLEMAVIASFLGILLSLPLSVLAARNLMPAFVTWPVRLLIMLCRSFHPVIVAIIFVKAVGFGALAGIGALTIASVGFLGKLYTEAIEEISPKQIEAVRATGASFMNTIVFGVVPQVMFRFIGFSAYETDANLRNSTMVGIVGAGGIGGDAVRRIPALRLRLRVRDPDRDHCADHGRRGVADPGEAGVQAMSAKFCRPGGSRIQCRGARNRGFRLSPNDKHPMNAVHPATIREWRRFTPSERFARYAIYLAIVAAVVVSAQSIEIIPEFLVDAPGAVRRHVPADVARSRGATTPKAFTSR